MRRWGWARHKGWGKHASLFSLVKQRIGCYNRHRKNVPGGIFPESSVIFIENNRSTGQSWAVISFGLLQVNTRLPRQAIQSRQIRSYSRTPFRGKEAATSPGTFHIYYMVHPGQKSNILSKKPVRNTHSKQDFHFIRAALVFRLSMCMSPVIMDIERTSLTASFHNRLLFYQ